MAKSKPVPPLFRYGPKTARRSSSFRQTGRSGSFAFVFGVRCRDALTIERVTVDASTGKTPAFTAHLLSARKPRDLVDLLPLQQIAPLRHAAVLALIDRCANRVLSLSRELAQVKSDNTGIDHVEAVAMRAMMHVQRRAPHRPFRDRAARMPSTRLSSSASRDLPFHATAAAVTAAKSRIWIFICAYALELAIERGRRLRTPARSSCVIAPPGRTPRATRRPAPKQAACRRRTANRRRHSRWPRRCLLHAILLPGNRLTFDARAGFELPELVTGFGVEGFEFAGQLSGEHQAAGGRQHPGGCVGCRFRFPTWSCRSSDRSP